MTDDASRCVLGCAQLGMRYGIANTTGQPDRAAALEIVSTCWAHGIRYFDTAQAYGDSEAVLGESLRALGAAGSASIISKVRPDLTAAPAEIERAVEASLERLGVDRLWGLMLHDERGLEAWDDGLGASLRALRDRQLVDRLGVSVYAPQRAAQALEHPDLQILQVPGGVFDRRMLRAGVLERAATPGKHVFVRSVYLQGLALMDADALPDRLDFARDAVAAYKGFCDNHGVERRRFALRYARDRFPSAMLVIGAETAVQAAENCRLMDTPGSDDTWYDAWDERWPDDVEPLVDPSRWPS
jgi:aryl-alcohol dehydrogenase-like predicted oxidoreductase